MRRFKKVNKNTEVIITDSSKKANNTSGQLPSETIAIAIGRIAGMIEKKIIIRDKKG